MKTITTHSEKETQEFAAKFAAKLSGGEVVALHGDLGAGKTSFAKGLAQALGVKKIITSPTFVLMKVYPCKKKNIAFLVHVDTYRLGSSQDLIDIGILDYLGRKDCITMIEWPEKVLDLLKNKKMISVYFEHGEREEERRIRVSPSLR